MNIRTCFNTIINNFENCLSEDDSQIDKAHIVKCVKESWLNARVYIKKIEPEYTKNYDKLIDCLTTDNWLLTESMIKETKERLSFLRRERNNIKLFINNYFEMLEHLIIFNRSHDEFCKHCQGSVFYFFDDITKSIVRECGTCGMIQEEEFDEVKEMKLRRAQRDELVRLKIDYK